MRNSTKMGGAIKKKYQVGGKVNNGRKGLDPVKDIDAFKKGAIKNPNMKMNPAKIQVGTTKPMTPAEKAKRMEDFMKLSPKKKMGGAKTYQKGGAIIASPIEGPRRKVAGSNMAKGGSLKPVNSMANPGLAKLPTPVRNKMGYMKKGGANPGFKAVQAKIAAKQGVSKKAAGAILAAGARKASAKAKAANPRLKRVK